MVLITCPRCNGKGTIPAHKHVLGGVCFKCGGKGSISVKSAPKPTFKFAIAVETMEGEVVSPCFHLNAKSEGEAIKKANAQIAKGNMKPGSASIAYQW